MQHASVTPLFPQDDLIEARRVLKLEAEALLELAQSLGGSFKGAVDLLMQTKGRVILSGIGKSGHIANKIASTFSSTGTPAFFVHPSEASHGDLGMITLEDTLIMLSLSGETAVRGRTLKSWSRSARNRRRVKPARDRQPARPAQELRESG